MSDSYPCPCCGHRVLDAMPGSYEIGKDDGVQSPLADRRRRYVRLPAEDELLDPLPGAPSI
ncbi:hypothetical protein [Streptomyces sp. NPDC096095]|uniref:hypothetical protein n=1 Tax=Streptomyces sp. NPDC096095 TaxID=3155545 RepID=UPI0033199FF4